MRITHDIHNHTLLSSCCYDPEATFAAFIDKAHELGHTTFGIANHMWDENVPGASKWYKGQPVKYVLEGKNSIPKNTYGMKILFGAEVEYCGMSDTLAITPETAKNFDYILVPQSHTHMRNFVMAEPGEIADLRAEMTARLAVAFPEFSEAYLSKMVGALNTNDLLPFAADTLNFNAYQAKFLLDSMESLINNPKFLELSRTVPTILAHPLAPNEGFPTNTEIHRLVDAERFYELCKRYAAHGIAFDVNMSTFGVPENGYRDDPLAALFVLARDAGVKFAFSTDSHSVEELETIRLGDALSERLELTPAHLWEHIV